MLEDVIINFWEHFWSKVEITGFCWNWRGYVTSGGYGRIAIKRKPTLAHRYSYESLVGPIPDGLTLDHLCRNRICVNPDHLEPVTQAENNRRKPRRVSDDIMGLSTIEKCKNGHEYTEENTYLYLPKNSKSYVKICRTCNRDKHRSAYQNKKTLGD